MYVYTYIFVDAVANNISLHITHNNNKKYFYSVFFFFFIQNLFILRLILLYIEELFIFSLINSFVVDSAGRLGAHK